MIGTKKQFSFFIRNWMKTPEIITSKFAKTQLSGQFTVFSFISDKNQEKPLFSSITTENKKNSY